MPAKSKAQQRLMAIAEHNPSALYKRNRGVTKMSHQQLHDFAATKTKSLPQRMKSSAAKKEMAKYRGEGHSYDFRRPKRKVISRYSK